MDQAFQGMKRFKLKVSGTGTFGKPKHTRVLWAGTEECPPLLKLQEKTVEALHVAEVDFDAKPFSQPLTLGRGKSPTHISAILDALDKDKNAAFGSVELS